MTTEDHFAKFYENIKLTSSQKEDAKTKYDGVCKKLHDFYYPSCEYTGNTKLLIGSYGKHTHIRPARDVDVIFMMPSEKYAQYDNHETNGQSHLLRDVREILLEKYPDTPIKAFGKVVVLEFADTKHNVEVLPSWEKEDGSFIIPNSENGGYWEFWDPRTEIQKVKDSDAETGKTKALIRMIKKWSENCSAQIKSFEIETKVLTFLGFYSAQNVFSKIIKEFFGFCYNTTLDNGLKSHFNTALSRATKAIDFEQNNNIDEAVDEWRKIFGDDFPKNVASRSSMSENTDIINVLDDHSHCMIPEWPFNKTNRVSIDAYVYDNSRNNYFSGLNSDGRKISPERSIKFVADTNARGIFDYHWQVVNTGVEARQAGDLRGGFTKSDKIHWENTRYRGKHWVECFIVQKNICIARSGKFFINIR